MEKYVSDTMAIVLYLEKRKLPLQIRNIFEKADTGQISIFIPSMVLAEIAYLSEKNKIELSIAALQDHMEQHPNYTIVYFGIEEIKTTFTITDIPELHDRMIAGAARYLNIKILSNDPAILASKFVESIWK